MKSQKQTAVQSYPWFNDKSHSGCRDKLPKEITWNEVGDVTALMEVRLITVFLTFLLPVLLWDYFCQICTIGNLSWNYFNFNI